MSPRIQLDSASPQAIDGRQVRAATFQKVRLGYVIDTMKRLGIDAVSRKVLVVGGGRGILPSGLARQGFDVTAVDPSGSATTMARAAAERDGLAIVYRTAPAEDLGAVEGSFDVAYYADTFEITSDLERVIEHAAGALATGGVLFYDTVNRTLLSRLVYLGMFQRIPMTRIMPRGRYAADRLRRPDELAEVLERYGLHNEDVCDFKPKNALGLLNGVRALRRGAITDEQIAAMVDFVLNPDGRPVVTYLGYARKRLKLPAPDNVRR
ncbi:methyltransferase domain-containing protein [Nocardia sp. NPDC050793]|uniref:methyltransferase domain-containing protein n=1 Tax=Nocardia sp. NPDC050793 TaxID=3155159 RepID=UPI003400F7AB